MDNDIEPAAVKKLIFMKDFQGAYKHIEYIYRSCTILFCFLFHYKGSLSSAYNLKPS